MRAYAKEHVGLTRAVFELYRGVFSCFVVMQASALSVGQRLLFIVDFSLFRPLEFFVDPKNGDGRNNNPPAMRVRVDCYTKKLPFRVQ